MTWPGKDGTGVITLAFRPVEPTPEVMTSESGAWAWLRMLGGGRLQPTGQPDLFRLRLSEAGYSADFDLQANSVDNPFDLQMFSRFACPDRILILPGFYGKLPPAGDFVAPPAARRLRPLLGPLGRPPPRRRASPTRGPSTSPSPTARSGRPGSSSPAPTAPAAASPSPSPRPAPRRPIAAWLAALAAAGAAAVAGELGPDALDARLLALPLAAAGRRRPRAAAQPLDRGRPAAGRRPGAPRARSRRAPRRPGGGPLMQIYNQTGFPHEFTMAMDKAGHEFILLVVKGTFDFPAETGGPVRPSETQVPLVMADEYTGAPGFSAPLWETDFAFRKPRCDIVLNGAAYAPGRRPATSVRVGLKVGAWSKVFDVFGHREWRARGPLFAATAPEPFLRRPISYDVAWGGTDRLDPDDPLPGAYLRNPVGTGWSQPKHQRLIPGLALPTTQAVGEDITSPFGDYTPDELRPHGPRLARPHRVRRHLRPELDRQRLPLPARPTSTTATTRWPRPTSRPPRPRGGEEVILANLTPAGKRELPPPRRPPCPSPSSRAAPSRSRPPSSPTPSSSTPRTAASRWSGASPPASTAPSSTSPKPGSAPPPSRCSAPAAKAAPTSAPPAPPVPEDEDA